MVADARGELGVGIEQPVLANVALVQSLGVRMMIGRHASMGSDSWGWLASPALGPRASQEARMGNGHQMKQEGEAKM